MYGRVSDTPAGQWYPWYPSAESSLVRWWGSSAKSRSPLALAVALVVLGAESILGVAFLERLVCVPLSVGISPAVLVVLAPLAILLNLAVWVVAVTAVVRNEDTMLPLTLSVLSTRIPLTSQIVGVNGTCHDA